jgi:hypothetical protein
MYFPPLDAIMQSMHTMGGAELSVLFLPTSYSIAICKGDIGNAIRLTREPKHHSRVIYFSISQPFRLHSFVV